MRSRYLAHAAHLATYTRVRSRARESFFPSLSSSVGSVTQSAREQRWDFEYLESNSLKNPKNFLRTFENRRIYSVAFFIFENCLGTGEWSKVGQVYSLRFRAIRICSSFFKSCAPIFASRAERKCFTIVAPNSLLEHILALS